MRTNHTRSQERILNLLKVLNRSLSAQDIYLELRNSDHSMGLATVYRSLDGLKRVGRTHRWFLSVSIATSWSSTLGRPKQFRRTAANPLGRVELPAVDDITLQAQPDQAHISNDVFGG